MTRDDIDRLWAKASRAWVSEGEPHTRYRFAALVIAAERERIGKGRTVAKVRVLKALGDGSMSVQEIMAATGMSQTAAKNVVYSMRKSGLLEREGPFKISQGGIRYTYKAR